MTSSCDDRHKPPKDLRAEFPDMTGFSRTPSSTGGASRVPIAGGSPAACWELPSGHVMVLLAKITHPPHLGIATRVQPLRRTEPHSRRALAPHIVENATAVGHAGLVL